MNVDAILNALERDGILRRVGICGQHAYTDGRHRCTTCGAAIIPDGEGGWAYYRPESNPAFTVDAKRGRLVHRSETGPR